VICLNSAHEQVLVVLDIEQGEHKFELFLYQPNFVVGLYCAHSMLFKGSHVSWKLSYAAAEVRLEMVSVLIAGSLIHGIKRYSMEGVLQGTNE